MVIVTIAIVAIVAIVISCAMITFIIVMVYCNPFLPDAFVECNHYPREE